MPQVNSSSDETHTGETEIRTVKCVYLNEPNCYRNGDKDGDTYEKGESRIWLKFLVIKKKRFNFNYAC